MDLLWLIFVFLISNFYFFGSWSCWRFISVWTIIQLFFHVIKLGNHVSFIVLVGQNKKNQIRNSPQTSLETSQFSNPVKNVIDIPLYSLKVKISLKTQSLMKKSFFILHSSTSFFDIKGHGHLLRIRWKLQYSWVL